MRCGGGPGREGVALVVVLLVLIALSLLGHGALVLARGEAAGARAFRRAVLGRTVAAWRVRAAAGALVRDTLPALDVGERHTLRVGADGASVLERLSSEFFLLSRTMPPGGRAHAGPAHRLLWALEPLARVTSTDAVLATAGPAAVAGRIEETDFFRVTAADGAACDPWRGPLASLAATRPPPFPVGSLRSVTGDLRSESGPADRVGLLGPDSLAARLPAFPGGVVTPAPVAGVTGCLDAPANWGSPSDPAGPCGGRRVGLRVPGSLTLDGGEGQGLLVVAGDLILRGGARLDGLVLVAGSLSVREGARIRGAVRVGGSAAVEAGSAVEGAACPVLAALSVAEALRRPVVLPDALLPLR